MIEATFQEVIKGSNSSNNDNGFRIYLFKVLKTDDERSITIGEEFKGIGNYIPAIKGSVYLLSGKWHTHEKYGTQYRITSYELLIPKSKDSIINFLTSGIFYGVTPSLANLIYSYFGNYSIDVLDSEPERLLDVPGIGTETAHQIQESYINERVLKNVFIKYKKLGVPEASIRNYAKDHGYSSVKQLEQDPYPLYEYDVSLSVLDRIAKSYNIPLESVSRVSACMIKVLKDNELKGHTVLPAEEFYSKVIRSIRNQYKGKIDKEMLSKAEELLTKNGSIIYTDQYVSRGRIYNAETLAVKHIFRLLKGFKREITFDIDSEIDKVELELKCKFHIQQRNAIKMALKYGFCVLCGGPGTGKTTVLKAIRIINEQKFSSKVIFSAPTGRAAARMCESSGYPAFTAHKLFKINPGSLYDYGSEYIQADCFVYDETSMVDIWDFAKIISSIPTGSQILLVGDVEQLPSIGPGAVLRDIIDSGQVPTTKLTKVFRQATYSNIYLNCRKIVNGNTSFEFGDDFVMLYASTMSEAAEYQVDFFLEEVERWGLDEVCLLTCHRIKGPCCANAANKAIQLQINPPRKDKPELCHNGYIFRLDDRVMHIKRNNAQVCNGELGYITGISSNSVEVNYSGTQYVYTRDDLEYLTLAYAMSIYKCQGSEFKSCLSSILPEFSQPQYGCMLQMNLLNTAISRAKAKFTLIGTDEAINIAIKNRSGITRNTMMKEKMKYYSKVLNKNGAC